MTCARCRKTLREGDYVYSRWTRAHYCLDFKRCDARARRLGLLEPVRVRAPRKVTI